MPGNHGRPVAKLVHDRLRGKQEGEVGRRATRVAARAARARALTCVTLSSPLNMCSPHVRQTDFFSVMVYRTILAESGASR